MFNFYKTFFHKTFLMALFLSAYVNCAHATLNAVIVSAARTEQSELTTPASITVITREDIDNSGAHQLVEVLQGRGGIQIFDSFGDGSRSSVGMRGFGETANANTLILVDGRRLNNSDISSPDLNSIALEDVQRIEIVQGSAGVLFGDQAVGGVINIITRKPEAQTYSLETYVGSYNNTGLHGMASQALDNGFNYRVSLDAHKSNNYRQNNVASYLNGFGRLGYENDTSSYFAELQYINDKLNTPGTLFDDELLANRRQASVNFANDFSDAKTTVGRVGVTHELNRQWSFESEITSRDTDGVFRLSSVFGAEIQNSTQNRKVKEFTPRVIATLPLMQKTLLTLGADFIESDYHLSSRFGDQFNQQTQQSIYLQSIITTSDLLDITAGVRTASIDNALRDTGTFALFPTGVNVDDTVTVGTFGLVAKLNNHWHATLRADQNYRFAKVDEFLSPAFTPTFTPVLLKTQKGLSLEASLQWSREQHSVKLVLYNLTIDNEIAFDPVNFANINLNKTERNGLIAEAHWQMISRWGMTASYTYTDANVVSGTFKGKGIPLVAKQSALINSNLKLTDQWQLYAELLLQGNRVFSGDFNNTLSQLPGYGVTNIKAEYANNDFSLSVRVNNLFDKHYTEVGVLGTDPVSFSSREAFFPSPERNYLLTAAWKFR